MKKTHYDILNLARNCTAKEVKDSFIKLSKKYHPDLNNNKEAHKKFVEINEAYSILGKVDKRKRYDDIISQRQYYRNGEMMGSNHVMWERYEAYEIYQRQYANSYYDFTSSSSNFLKSKITSFLFCCVLLTFGTAIQLSAIRRNDKLKCYYRACHVYKTRAKAEI